MSEASDEENVHLEDSGGRSTARTSKMVEEAKAYSAGLAKRGVVRSLLASYCFPCIDL